MLRVGKCIKALGENKYAEFEKENQSSLQLNMRIKKGLASGKGKSQSTSQQAGEGETNFDFENNYRERIVELLNILNMTEAEAFYTSQYKYEPPPMPETKMDDDVSAQLAGSQMYPSPQLPALPSKSTATGIGKGEREEYKFLGPVYLLVANVPHDRYQSIMGYLYFPSMTKDARPAPNYDHLGKAHRWLHRFIKHDLYNMEGTHECKNVCNGIRNETRTKYKGVDYYISCGCSTPSDSSQPRCRQEINRRRKNPGPPVTNYFTAYRINMQHISYRSYFASDSPEQLLLNIIPSSWDIFPGCKYIVMSRNDRFYMKFETVFVAIPGTVRGRGRGRTELFWPYGVFTVYHNEAEDLVELCNARKQPTKSTVLMYVGKRGTPKRMVLERNLLKMYCALDPEGKQETEVWSLQAGLENADMPLAFVLLDDGKVQVFDRNNKPVVSQELTNLIEEGTKGVVALGDDITLESGEYDPEKEYQRRLEHLKDWLRLRKLLIEDVATVINLNSATIRSIVGEEETGRALPYDEKKNYKQRMYDLVAFLKSNGYPDAKLDAIMETGDEAKPETKPLSLQERASAIQQGAVEQSSSVNMNTSGVTSVTESASDSAAADLDTSITAIVNADVSDANTVEQTGASSLEPAPQLRANDTANAVTDEADAYSAYLQQQVDKYDAYLTKQKQQEEENTYDANEDFKARLLELQTILENMQQS